MPADATGDEGDRIDMRSDTVTTPTERMRDAAHTAAVGDDKRDGDPTVRELEAETARLLGMDDAVFVPSGTMGNQIAVKTHTTPGREIICDRWAHVYTSEFADLALLSQLQVRPVEFEPAGCPTPEELRAAVAERAQWPGVGLVSLENTHNRRGGRVVEPAAIDDAARTAHELGLPVHLDGARLANASVALSRPLDAFTGEVDTVMFDLSKGLSAPVGAVLAGDAEVVEEARNYRHAFGGGMRQAGIIAAPGLVALERIDNLQTDHENADRLADGLERETSLGVQRPETNLVMVETTPAGVSAVEFAEACGARGVLVGTVTDSLVRFCTHRNVTREDVDVAVARIQAALEAAA